MATVDKEVADRLVRNNGYWDDEDRKMGRRTVLITEYDTAFDGVAYGLTSQGRPSAYTPSRYVRNPRIYWRAEDIG